MRTHRHVHVPRLRCMLGLAAVLAAATASTALAAETPQPFADASYRDAQVVPTDVAPLPDASYREASIALPESVPPLAVDASYREANRVVVPATTAGEGFDWTDGLIGGAVVLGIVAAIGAGVAVFWTTRHHGPRHPRGPAVPTH